MVLLSETAPTLRPAQPTTPSRSPPSRAMDASVDYAPAKPMSRALSAPGLVLRGLAEPPLDQHPDFNDYRAHIGAAPNTGVPTIAVIRAASRRPGLVQTTPGDLRRTADGVNKKLRQSESAQRLVKPLERVPASTQGAWPPYYDPKTQAGFTRDLTANANRYSGAFQSRQPRMLIETDGTYRGTDPRALHADGVYSGYVYARTHTPRARPDLASHSHVCAPGRALGATCAPRSTDSHVSGVCVCTPATTLTNSTLRRTW